MFAMKQLIKLSLKITIYLVNKNINSTLEILTWN